MLNMRESKEFSSGGSRSIWLKWLISRKTVIFQGSRGVQHFPGGGGGSNFSFPIETHITCDLPGVVRTPCPPSGSAFAENVNTIFSVVLMILGVINPPKYVGIYESWITEWVKGVDHPDQGVTYQFKRIMCLRGKIYYLQKYRWKMKSWT